MGGDGVGKDIAKRDLTPSAFGTSPTVRAASSATAVRDGKYDNVKFVCGFKLLIVGFGGVCMEMEVAQSARERSVWKGEVESVQENAMKEFAKNALS